MEFADVLRTTFAARQFTDDPLPDDTLWAILDDARFAPSGGNRQGAHIVVVRDPDTRQSLVELGLPAARRYLAQRAAGENPWNPVHPTSVTQRDIDAVDGAEAFQSSLTAAQVVLVVCVELGVLAAVDQDLDRVGLVGGASVYPLVWNILLAARSRGFGGTLTTVAIAAEPQLRELLAIPDTHAVVALLPLGKPVKQLTRLRRQPVEDFVTREMFDGEPFTAGQ